MALVLSTELSNGVSGNYWRISYVTVDCQKPFPTVDVNMALYISEDHKKNGKDQISFTMLNFNLLDIDATFSYDFRACLYNAIKQLPQWADSTDALDEFIEPEAEPTPEPVEEPIEEPAPIVEEPIVEPQPETFAKKKIR